MVSEAIKLRVAKEDPPDKSNAGDLCFEKLYDYDKDLKKRGVGEANLLCVQLHTGSIGPTVFLTMSIQRWNSYLRILGAAWPCVALELKPPEVVGCIAIKRIIAMILKCITFLFSAAALAGCCLSGNGCYTSSPGTPIAWDGLGSSPTDNETTPKPKRTSRPKKEIVVGPLNQTPALADPIPQSHDRWAEDQAADQDADAKLKQQMQICSNC
jgi:hypothetical protein